MNPRPMKPGIQRMHWALQAMRDMDRVVAYQTRKWAIELAHELVGDYKSSLAVGRFVCPRCKSRGRELSISDLIYVLRTNGVFPSCTFPFCDGQLTEFQPAAKAKAAAA